MITIDYGNTNIISVEQEDLTLVNGTFYTHDTEVFRNELKEIEATEEGIVFPDTHVRSEPVTVAGTTLAQSISIISPYTVQYEDGQYTVQLEGSNNNIWSVQDGILSQNQVQVIPTNSAGLVVVAGGGSGSASDVWSDTATYPDGSKGDILQKAKKAADFAGQISA